MNTDPLFPLPNHLDDDDRPLLPQKNDGGPVDTNYGPQFAPPLTLKDTAEIRALAEQVGAATGRDAHLVEHEIRNLLYVKPLAVEEVQRALDALHTPLPTSSDSVSVAMGHVARQTRKVESKPTRLYWLQHNDGQPIRRPSNTPGRNDPCPCGSGKKFKKCCLRRGGAR